MLVLSRRSALLSWLGFALVGSGRAETDSPDLYFGVPSAEIAYPDQLDPFRLYGYNPPSQEQESKAAAILRSAPMGPRPIDVARYFTSEAVDPHYRDSWPRDDAWNPVIVKFCSAANYNASDDMVPWCAAFVNWCLVRAGRRGSGSPSSQSFLRDSHFRGTSSPQEGDLVIFTCHRVSDDADVGFGHVGFFVAQNGNGIDVLGGNQGKSGAVHQINQALFPRTSRDFKREGITVKLKFRIFVKFF